MSTLPLISKTQVAIRGNKSLFGVKCGFMGKGRYDAVLRGMVGPPTRSTEGGIFPLRTKLTEMEAYGGTVDAHAHDCDWALGGLVGGIASGTGDFGIVDMAIALATPGQR